MKPEKEIDLSDLISFFSRNTWCLAAFLFVGFLISLALYLPQLSFHSASIQFRQPRAYELGSIRKLQKVTNENSLNDAEIFNTFFTLMRQEKTIDQYITSHKKQDEDRQLLSQISVSAEKIRSVSITKVHTKKIPLLEDYCKFTLELANQTVFDQAVKYKNYFETVLADEEKAFLSVSASIKASNLLTLDSLLNLNSIKNSGRSVLAVPGPFPLKEVALPSIEGSLKQIIKETYALVKALPATYFTSSKNVNIATELKKIQLIRLEKVPVAYQVSQTKIGPYKIKLALVTSPIIFFGILGFLFSAYWEFRKNSKVKA